MKKLATAAWLLTFLWSIEIGHTQTWIRQNPFPVLAQLQDIDLDGMTGVAVGDQGLCFTTTDNGVTWHRRFLPYPEYSYTTAYMVPGTNGQVMYIGGINLLVSRDGGISWDVAHNGLSQIYKVQSYGPNTLMVLGANIASYTTDGGENWEVIPMPADDVSAGHFIDPLHGWVESGGFNEVQVHVTSNGGQTWDILDPLMHPVISAIEMLDNETGFLAARDFVYKTTDGGQHWELMHDNAVNSIQDMYVVDEQHIWTCLINGFTWHTTNGGDVWTETNPNVISSNRTNGIYANEEGEVWTVGKFVSILHYDTEFGAWFDQIPTTKTLLYKSDFASEWTGIVGGSSGSVLLTTNGGAAWRLMYFGEDQSFFGASMVDSLTSVVGSSSGDVYYSADGGFGWGRIGENLGPITDLHAFTQYNIVVTTETGLIRRTIDGGFNWDVVHTSNQGLIQSVEFFNAQLGWACGWFGQILHTTDGGGTWTPQNSNSNAQFEDIHFVSETEGWAVSSSFVDSIWHTLDGGTTWVAQSLPFTTFWRGVSFHSPDTGWIAGGSAGSGLILRTNDGGDAWFWDHQSPEALFSIHALPGQETVWSTGVGGNIVKYSPCTFNPEVYSIQGPATVCERDTVEYSVSFNGISLFEWTFPSGWFVTGNPNASTVTVIPGSTSGAILVSGIDACNSSSNTIQQNVMSTAVPLATITETEETIECDLAGTSYQWYFSGNIIPGANASTYTPTSSGEHYCIVTLPSGCVSVSNKVFFILSSTTQPDIAPFTLHPNPVTTDVCIQMQSGTDLSSIDEIMMVSPDARRIDVSISNTGRIDMSLLPPGIYTLAIRVDGMSFEKRVVKIK